MFNADHNTKANETADATMELAKIIRSRMDWGQTANEIHNAFTRNGNYTEEQVFLAYHAAKTLNTVK